MQVLFIKNDHVVLDNALGTLYGARIVSCSESFKLLEPEKIETILKRSIGSGKSNNFLFLVVKKTQIKEYPDFNKAFKTELLLFTYSPVMIREILAAVPTAVQMDGVEIANTVFRCHTLTDSCYFHGKSVKYDGIPYFDKGTVFVPPVGKTYRSFFLNEIERKKVNGRYPFRIYKGMKIDAARPDMETLLSLPWQGVLWIRFNMNNIHALLKSRANMLGLPQDGKRFWKEFADRYKAGEEPVAVMEVTFISDDNDATSFYTSIFNALSLTPLEWYKNYDRLIMETPLNAVDPDFELIVYPDRIASYIPISFFKNTYVDSVDTVFGTNKSGEFVSFSFFEEAQSPHALIIAPTRSGKSFLMQNLVTELAGIDCESLFNGKIERTDIPMFVRYFDVGFSAEFLMKLLEARGFSTEVVSPSPEVKLNPVEIDSREEIDISIQLINLILATKRFEPMNGLEEGFFRRALEFILDNPSFFSTLYLREVEKTHPQLYRFGREQLGLKDDDTIEKLREHVDVLRYPRVSDVMRKLHDLELEIPPDEKEKRDAIASLVAKLDVVRSIPNFASWSDFSPSGKKFVYFDLNFLKSTSVFVPAYMGILVKIMRSLKKEDIHVPKLLVSDEFHNVSKYDVFASMFNVLVREAAKFNIYLFFVSQNPTDVPKDVATNVATKIFLKPALDVKSGGVAVSPSELFENAVRDHYALTDEAFNLFKNLPKYTPLFLYPSGHFTLKPPVDEYKLKLFESRKITEIETPDGIKLKKSYVVED